MDEKILRLHQQQASIREISRITGKSTTYVSKVILLSNVSNPIEELEKGLKGDERIFAICKRTGTEISDYRNKGGVILEHVMKYIPEFKIESKYKRKSVEMKTGRFWYHDFFDFIVRKVDLRKCRFCDWTTIDTENKSGCYTSHLKEIHEMEIEKYVEIFPDEKDIFKTFMNKMDLKSRVEYSDEYGIRCGICKEFMRKITNTHLLQKHGITIGEYKKKYGRTISNFSSKLISISSTENNRKMTPKRKNTWIELALQRKMEEIGIDFTPQFGLGKFYYDFLIKDYELLIEADGFFWHGHDRVDKWYFKQFNNIINDYKKSFGLDNLIRLVETKSINTENLNQISSIDSFLNFLQTENSDIKQHPLFNLKEDVVIFDKEYCRDKADLFIKERVDSNLHFLMSELYNPKLYRNFINLDCRTTIESKIKAIFFEPFYSAHKIGNHGLEKTFYAGNNLMKTIQYRLGINKSKELFDVSIKNIYRGLEVRTMFNVGIFPVNQAKEIFGKYVGYNEVVFDPFSGWGSRMLGASSIMDAKSSTYIGFDSNQSLESCYKKILADNVPQAGDSVQLHIRDSRDFEPSLSQRIDFVFTSPPFYNDEIYNEDQKVFGSIEEWLDELITPVFKNCQNYLKKDCFLLIDMKSKYSEPLIESLVKIGFSFEGKEQYKVKKSHYSSNEKFQEILIFKRR